MKTTRSVTFLRRTVQKALERMGWRLVRMDGSIRRGFEAQAAFLGYCAVPPIIFDVGASKGVTVAEYREQFTSAKIYAFEPFSVAYDRLRQTFANDPDVVPIHRAVSDRRGERVLHVQPSTDSNSLLPSSLATTKDASTQQLVQTTTLDAFCEEQRIDQVDILKMDIQGAELEALRGAKHLLEQGRVRMLYLEVQFISLYEGQAWGSEIMEFLRGYGYAFVDLYDRRYAKDGSLKWADALFVKR